ncbi:Aste57867_1556 [Aphanomyces stellatus]|uniref:Aste57867_1556 protein n=1 Tax=Aphanomyces stellatus TaxID=120398 RepID=A0A485K9P7_9STRA|nr:hypothetical protein As57867_001555 [Aphanomyces stellatus]VFT78770.1 Aste57867_1556 [Aphanomyces stellatus]
MSFRNEVEAQLMGREDLTGYQMVNGVYKDPNESEEDDEDGDVHGSAFLGATHKDKSTRMLRSVSSPNIGPGVPVHGTQPPLLSPVTHHPGEALKRTLSPPTNLPEAIMAALHKMSPTSPTSAVAERERKMSSVLDTTGTSVFVSSLLLPPAFASLTICENCKVEVGTLLTKPRHHCRNCGGTFCQDCSAKTSVIPYDALLAKGELRVCDCCFLKIREFQSQTGTTQCSWNGLRPLPDTDFVEHFSFSDSQTPVVILSCCFFPDCVPYYGHMYLTREHICFKSYKSKQAPICIPYDDITAVVKPEFYFINALQLKTDDKSWFFAEFNGQRDMCFGRLDQLIGAHRQQFKESEHTPEVLKEMASQRRQSYLISNRRNSIAKEDEDFVPLPPDDTLSTSALAVNLMMWAAKMTKILDCELQTDLQTLFDVLFSNAQGQDFYQKVMVSTKDIDISIGDWQPIDTCPKDAMSSLSVSTDTFSYYRKVQSKHPPKVSFPGLPPYADCTRYQLCRHDATIHDGEEKSWTRFVLAETLRMKQIPYADYFEIETRWVFTRDGHKFCHAEVGIIVHFIKSTWFNNQIISSTISESREAFETWASHAVAALRQHSPSGSTPPKNGNGNGDKAFPASTKGQGKATVSSDKATAPPAVTATMPFSVPTTTAGSIYATIFKAAQQQPLWVFTVLLCLYMLYAMHAMHGTLRDMVRHHQATEAQLLAALARMAKQP